jgi:hypothetical protein
MAGTDKKISAKTTKTDMKKLLSDPKYRIELHELVQEQTKATYKSVENLNVQAGGDVLPEAQKAIIEFESTTSELRMTMAYGCYFGTPDQAYLWGNALTQLSTIPQLAGSVFLLKLQLYPALLVFYTGGLAALAAKNTTNLKAIFNVKSNDNNSEPHALVISANCTMLDQNAGNQIFKTERLKTPLSDHLFKLFDDKPLKELAFGQDFAQLFDEWEILIGMVFADILKDNKSGFNGWAPVGRFSWRGQYSGGSTLKSIKKQLAEDKPDWTPLKAGLFNGDVERARAALDVVENIADKVSFF